MIRVIDPPAVALGQMDLATFFAEAEPHGYLIDSFDRIFMLPASGLMAEWEQSLPEILSMAPHQVAGMSRVGLRQAITTRGTPYGIVLVVGDRGLAGRGLCFLNRASDADRWVCIVDVLGQMPKGDAFTHFVELGAYQTGCDSASVLSNGPVSLPACYTQDETIEGLRAMTRILTVN